MRAVRTLLGRVPRAAWPATAVTVLVAGGVVAVVQLTPSAVAAVDGGATEAVSVDGNGTVGRGRSNGPAVSADGRYVAFASTAALEAGQSTREHFDVYLRDTTGHTTTLLSRGGPAAPGPVGGDGDSIAPTVSADGRYVAFETTADDVAGATRTRHVAVCDRGTGGPCTFTAVTWPGAKPTDTVGDAHLSADGTRLAVLEAGHAGVVTLGHTADGKVVTPDPGAFVTPAVPATLGDAPYVGDLRVALSANGRYLARVSVYEINKIDSVVDEYVLWVSDLSSVDTVDAPVRLDLGENGQPVGSDTVALGRIAISGDGRRVAFETLSQTDPPHVYAVDRDPDGDGSFGPAPGEKASAVIASRDNSGAVVPGSGPTLSTDGRYLGFATDAAGAHDGVDDPTRPFSDCNHPEPVLQAVLRGGRAVQADPPPTGISYCDIVVRDLVVDAQRAAATPPQPRLSGELASPSIRATCRGAVAGSPCEGTGDSEQAVLDGDGSAVAFTSGAADLVDGDANRADDVFLRRFQPSLAVDPTDFGKVVQDSAVTGEVPVHQVGFGPLDVQAATVGGPDAADFTVLPGGTCVGGVLHETDSCFVAVQFKPSTVGGRTAALTVTPVRLPPATGALTGVGAVRPPPRTPGFLATPDPLAFGQQQPYAPSPVKQVTVTNPGTAPLVVTAVTVVGAAPTGFPADYQVTADTCLAAPVAPGTGCTVSVVFTPHAVGNRPALLQFTDNAKPGPQVVALTGAGRQPVLVAAPPLAPAGAVSQVTGAGFPPNRPVVLTLDNMPGRVTVTADGAGGFRAPLVILPHTRLGKRQLHATVQGVTPPIVVSVDFLVVPGSLQPPDFAERR